ncbi:hypothetical protein PT974_06818 [Cladobotryum mycophilum]|uniref:F-box domain-containing protein n=1 Tax=Cladobotryum mycophilum TaxID=491253 RepID=A0ABR0SMI9_9HYPO
MRLPFRRKDKKKQDVAAGNEKGLRSAAAIRTPYFPPSYRSAQLIGILPGPVLERIFAFVCPHAQDQSYDTCEESTNESGCMLCDLRDLAHSSQVNRSWHASAIKVLYHSVRIDQVHYCSREAVLADRRKHTHRFDKNGIPEDPAQARLRLLRRTVREDPTRIGKRVQFLKIPYMLREYCHVELAQTIAVLPNLKYIDLPEGMFADEPSYATLRLEVQARCPNIRKMAYNSGSEHSFAVLATGQVWRRLEVLELNGIDIDTASMRSVLGSLECLRALKVTKTESLSDEVLTSGDGLPLPALEEIILEDTPRVTAAGLIEYLAWQETQQALKVLTLKYTGVNPKDLQEILIMAPKLRTLAIQSKISEPFPHNTGIGLLSSGRLETLRYEIAGRNDTGPYATMKASYYSYLASSIIGGYLPKLARVYVLDDTFPDQLAGLPLPPYASFASAHARSSSNSSLSAVPGLRLSSADAGMLSPSTLRRPSAPGFAPATHRFSSNNPFAAQVNMANPHALEIYTKTDLVGKWNFSRVDTFSAGAGQHRRPSSYGLAADVAGQGWDRGEARRSVMISDSSGMFLPVPGQQDTGGLKSPSFSDPWQRPRSSGESTRRR